MSGQRRADGRTAEDLRKIEISTGYTKWAEGSVLCSFGDTRVVCNATIEDRVPPWLKEQKKGWITAEYAMLPRATDRRTQRESVQGRIGGRTHEISRLIGRSLRAGANLAVLGERSITLDCDVLQADGGTRTAAITGAWVAVWLACQKLVKAGSLASHPLRGHIAAVSLGVVRGEVMMDLSYQEDQAAETDLNLVMNGEGAIVEIQGTAEGAPFSRGQLERMLELGHRGIADLVRVQRAAIAGHA